MQPSYARVAVIDLGTNTFHLLIARPDGLGGFTEVYRERRFIKLAEDGIETIGAAPWQRGMEAMQAFARQLNQYGITEVRALGTAALRTAGNGQEFVRLVKARTGISIELIDGDEEARLIHLGTRLAVPFDEQVRLIMDIGGGSVEFILADRDQVYWARSFPLGVAVLYKQYHTTDPLPEQQILALQAFLAEALQPLKIALQAHPVTELIGASGTFDVMENYLGQVEPELNCTVLSTEAYAGFRNRLIAMPLSERLVMEGMPPARAEMLPVALVLLDSVFELAGIERILVSPFALKEGVLAEMLG